MHGNDPDLVGTIVSTGPDGRAPRAWAASDASAHRPHNQDFVVNRTDLRLWAVADGCGGHTDGGVASRLVGDTLHRTPAHMTATGLVAHVHAAMAEVHQALRRTAAAQGADTVVAATVAILIQDGDRYVCLWAGDTRVYRLRAGQLAQLTRDHSIAEELLASGMISEDMARNHPGAETIVRAVGGNAPNFALDTVAGPIEPGDVFMLCSDGIYKALPAAMMEALLELAGPYDPADALVRAALSRDVRDNVTSLVVQFPAEC